MTPMPWDFIGYILLAAAIFSAVAIGAGWGLANLGDWLKQRKHQAWREREGRRDGYVSDGDTAEGLDRLIVDGRINVHGDRDRWAS